MFSGMGNGWGMGVGGHMTQVISLATRCADHWHRSENDHGARSPSLGLPRPGPTTDISDEIRGG